MNDKPGWEAQYQIDTLRADLAKAQAESEAAAKRWDEENASLAAQLAKAQARCAELAEAAESVVEYGRCFLFALTEHDKPHQDHYREMLEVWQDKLAKLLSERETP